MAVNLDAWNQVSTLKSLRKDFNDTPKGKQFRSLKLNEVVSVAQVRRTFTGLEELADSLKEVGQQSPIVVRPKNDEGLYVILQGERRWRAAQLAGLERIDAIVVENDVETNERIFGQLTENIQRDDMRPLEIAAAIHQLLDAGLKSSEIAAKLGHKPSYVALYRDLFELPELVRQLAEQEKIRDATTLQILKKIYAASPDNAEELIRTHLDDEGGISRAAARRLLGRAQAPKNETPTSVVTTSSSDVSSTKETTEVTTNDVRTETVEQTTDKPSDKKERSRQPATPSGIRHKLQEEDEDVNPEDFELPETETTLPEGARRLQQNQVNIKLSIIDQETNEVQYGNLVPNVVSNDPAEVCVLTHGRYMFWPVSQVHIETVVELKDDALAGW